MKNEKTFDFKPGDIIEYMGLWAEVIINNGSNGLIKVIGDDEDPEDPEEWSWIMNDINVTLVQSRQK